MYWVDVFRMLRDNNNFGYSDEELFVKPIRIPKKSGGMRTVGEPTELLKDIIRREENKESTLKGVNICDCLL